MATRAAWLHFAGGLTQAEVARRLGLTGLKAHRLIARASREGLVKVYIDGEVSECLALEDRLSAAYRLGFCQVVPDLEGGPETADPPFKALGMAGGQFLRRALEAGDDALIGVGHGRTLAAAVEHLPRMAAGATRFVSLLGGLTRKFAATPYDVIHRLAERTGAEAYVLPVPFLANTAEDRAVLTAQRGVKDVFDLAAHASLLFVGIGAVESGASLVATGMIEPAEIAALEAAGARGELLGHFFDEDGAQAPTGLSRRTLSLPREDLRDRKIVAVAGGTAKVEAIRAILRSGLLHGLITDERSASALVGASPARATPGNGKAKPRQSGKR